MTKKFRDRPVIVARFVLGDARASPTGITLLHFNNSMNQIRTLTFSSQQCRAFNLVWALVETGQLQPGDTLAVVGAGLAGITVAAAACIRGVQVTVFEQANQSMAIQRGNFVRYIHPNILDWPEPGSNRHATDWDTLNWEAATLDNVVAQIDQGWTNCETAVTMHFRYRVDAIDEVETQIKATALEPELSSIEKNFDAIVIAVGFGIERTLENIPLRSYWLNDDLHQESTAEARRLPVLVTGFGDGGLIDVLRLRFKNFDHARFVKDVLDTLPGGFGLLHHPREHFRAKMGTLVQLVQMLWFGTVNLRPNLPFLRQCRQTLAL